MHAASPQTPGVMRHIVRTPRNARAMGYCLRGFYQKLAPKEAPQKLNRVALQGASHVNKFQHIQPPLAAVVLGDKGLRAFQALCHDMLGQAGLAPGRDQKVAECLVLRRMQGFGKTACLFDHKAGENDPRLRLRRIFRSD